MKIIIIVIFFYWILFLPLFTGVMAKKSGLRFWTWFWLSIQLPLISNLVLLIISEKSAREKEKVKPVENDEIFDHLFLANAEAMRWLSLATR